FAASKLITMYYREAIVPNTLAMLLDILLDAEGAAYNEILAWFTANPEQAVALIEPELKKGLPPDASEKDKDDLAKRQAHAAVVLLQLDESDGDIWRMLGQSADPRLRSHLIDRLSKVGLNPETLIQQYRDEKDV